MKCPVCNVELLMTDKQGVEIDYCPTCRGIWLDRGELDKIIERSTVVASAPHPENRSRDHDEHRYEAHRRGRDDHATAESETGSAICST